MGKDSIRTISVRGFKGIKEMDLELRQLNVLIGANGVGKSNFLGVFELLRALDGVSLMAYVARAGGADRLLHFGSKVTSEIKVYVTFTSGIEVRFMLDSTAEDRLLPSISYSVEVVRDPAAQHFLGALRVFHFADAGPTSRMRKTAAINDNLELQKDGANLAAVLDINKAGFSTSKVFGVDEIAALDAQARITDLQADYFRTLADYHAALGRDILP